MYGILVPVLEKIEEFEDMVAEDIRITGHGGTYKIEIPGISVNTLADAVVDYVTKYPPSEIIRKLMEETSTLQKSVKNSLNAVLTLMGSINDVKQYLRDLEQVGHAARMRAGRTSQKGFVRAWLAISPTSGKFFQTFFKAQDKAYMMCRMCIGIACIGLFSHAILYGRGRTLIIVPAFEGEVGGDAINGYFIDLRDKADDIAQLFKGVYDKIPERVLSQIAIAQLGNDVIKEFAEQEALWKVFSVVLEKGATQLRGFCEVDIDPLISGLYDLCMREGGKPIDDFRNLLKDIMKLLSMKYLGKTVRGRQISTDVDVLEKIFHFFGSRSAIDLYDLSRAVYLSAKDQNRSGFGDKLCKGLASLIREQ